MLLPDRSHFTLDFILSFFFFAPTFKTVTIFIMSTKFTFISDLRKGYDHITLKDRSPYDPRILATLSLISN